MMGIEVWNSNWLVSNNIRAGSSLLGGEALKTIHSLNMGLPHYVFQRRIRKKELFDRFWTRLRQESIPLALGFEY